MEFNFDITKYFKNEITKIGSRLIPEGFIGDRRELQDCVTRMSLVLTVLGEYSAKAQGLQKVITSGERLRNSEHIVYILTDPKGGTKGTGCVLGMLKMGCKHLYVFDAGGNNHEVTARCVLDFYIHESKQRMGLGRRLFQHMLKEENIEPQHLAIDKPSPKFLSFLHKHYGLETIIPQMNNFVVFDGFFTNRLSQRTDTRIHAAGLSSLVTRYSSGTLASFTPSPIIGTTLSQPPPQPQPQPQPQIQTTTSTTTTHSQNMNNAAHYGRHAAIKPVSTMGMILQQKPVTQQPTQPGSKEKNGESTVSENENPENNPSEPEDHQSNQSENQSVNNDEPDGLEEEANEENADVEEEVTSVAVNATERVPTPSEGASGTSTPMRCNTQAATAPHLDLKFYHSSLW